MSTTLRTTFIAVIVLLLAGLFALNRQNRVLEQRAAGRVSTQKGG